MRQDSFHSFTAFQVEEFLTSFRDHISVEEVYPNRQDASNGRPRAYELTFEDFFFIINKDL